MGRQSLHRLRLGLFLGVGLAAAAIAFGADAAGILRSQEQATVDVRFSIRGPAGPPNDVVIVPIDDITFNQLAVRWPFPRTLHAKVIDRLKQAGAKVIAFDVQFTEPTTMKADNALIDAVGRAGNLVLATTEVNATGLTNVLGGESVLAPRHAIAANALLPSDANGVIRRVPYQVDNLKSFSIVAAERMSGKTIEPSDLGGSRAWIDYVGPPGTIQGISFSRVISGHFPKDFFRGKVAVVGPVAPSLQDVHPTSVGGGELMSGAEIQANAIWTALHGFPLKNAWGGLNELLIILLALVPPLAGLRLSPFRVLGISVAAGAMFAGLVQLAFDHGRVFGFVYPLVALAVAALGTIALRSVMEVFERERMRDLFGRFVPETVIDEVLAQTKDGIHLGGKMRVCTMMFTDLRGFTTFSESRSAEDVINILNYYFGEMTQAVLDHGGTLMSYLGDGMMAVFGAPLDQDDHADRAVATGREMILERLPRVNAWLKEQGYGEGFRMGIGLNSGQLMVGNIGSERRMEYTTIGDTVNTASRIEGLTKGTPFPLFLSDSTRELLHNEPDDLVFIDELEIRGRSEKVKMYALTGLVERRAPEPAPAAAAEAEAGVPAIAPAGR
jgi:adenylate cyclase